MATGKLKINYKAPKKLWNYLQIKINKKSQQLRMIWPQTQPKNRGYIHFKLQISLTPAVEKIVHFKWFK